MVVPLGVPNAGWWLGSTQQEKYFITDVFRSPPYRHLHILITAKISVAFPLFLTDVKLLSLFCNSRWQRANQRLPLRNGKQLKVAWRNFPEQSKYCVSCLVGGYVRHASQHYSDDKMWEFLYIKFSWIKMDKYFSQFFVFLKVWD